MRLGELIGTDDRGFAVYPPLLRRFGTKATVFLCRIIWWAKDPEEWITKGTQEIEDQTGLTYEEQRAARKTLVELGILQEEYKRLNHELRFRVNPEALHKELDEFSKIGKQEKSKSRSRKSPVPEMGKVQMGNEEKSKSDDLGKVQMGKPENPRSNIVKENTKDKDTKKDTRSRAPLLLDVLPTNLDTPAFREVWGKWQEYLRKRSRKPITEHTLELHLKKLAPLGSDHAIFELNYAIERSWSAPFPKPRTNFSGSGKRAGIADVGRATPREEIRAQQRITDEDRAAFEKWEREQEELKRNQETLNA